MKSNGCSVYIVAYFCAFVKGNFVEAVKKESALASKGKNM